MERRGGHLITDAGKCSSKRRNRQQQSVGFLEPHPRLFFKRVMGGLILLNVLNLQTGQTALGFCGLETAQAGYQYDGATGLFDKLLIPG
jgi:hypothetical protein